MKSRLVPVILAFALLAAACGGDDDAPGGSGDDNAGQKDSFNQPFTDAAAYPVFASSELTVGENRLLIGLLNQEDAPIASEKIDVGLTFFDLSKSEPTPEFSTESEFARIDEFRGLYVSYVEFDSAGEWGAEVDIEGDGYDETLRASLTVSKKGTTPAIGEPVPASDTPTIDDVDELSEITTDQTPVRRFYTTSVAEAVRQNKPFVVAFATPKFCTSQTCGPILEEVQEVADEFPKVTFIHVEPYDLDKTPDLVPIDVVHEWGLPSEPWVFVVDSDGKLVAKYDVVLSQRELTGALKKL
ncbi:MAG: thioredoxin family protein [Actinomycetota bacterium]